MALDKLEKPRDSFLTKFVSPPSSHLKCPICNGIYTEPVINIKCGHTFCRNCAFSAMHCPLDNAHCDTSQLVVNRLVVGQIEDLRIQCRHGLMINHNGELVPAPDSCKEVISFMKRIEHEDKCIFALISCPNSEACPKFRKKDLDLHMRLCKQIHCTFAKLGCNYIGAVEKVNEHSVRCLYQRGAPSNGNLTTRVAEQELAMQALQAENEKLVLRVKDLEVSRCEMHAHIEKQANMLKELEQKLENLTFRLESAHPSTPRRRLSSTCSHSQLSLVDGGTRSSGSRNRSSSPGTHCEQWEMPLQFKCIGTLRGHKDVVWATTSRKGHLYSGGANGLIKIWSLEQLAKGCVGNINAHRGVIHCLTTWGNTLLSAGADKSIAFWDIETKAQKAIIENAHDDIICSMVVCDNLLFTSSFAVIKVWDLKSLQTKMCLEGENHWVRALAVGRGKDKLYSGSHNAINVWDSKETFEKLSSIELEGGSVYSLAVTKAYIIAGSSGNYDKYIQLFDIETHEFVMNFCGHIGTVTNLVASPSGQFLFSASHDSTIQMWGLEFKLPIQNLSRHQGSVNTLTLHGDFLLSGSEDHEIKVFRYFRMQ